MHGYSAGKNEKLERQEGQTDSADKEKGNAVGSGSGQVCTDGKPAKGNLCRMLIYQGATSLVFLLAASCSAGSAQWAAW
jgi:hypothetical protein